MSIEVRNIHKHFGNFAALRDVSLRFPAGKLTALLGPSGCGKTTLLRIIAGLEQPDAGQIILNGTDASRWDVRERQVGFVFQHYALFRHMTVFDNVAFGLRVKPRRQRLPEKQIRAQVMRLLELVQLDWLAKRYPPQLSGGQRQRIALARAVAADAPVLVLHDPTTAVDAVTEQNIAEALIAARRRTDRATLLVTRAPALLREADRVVFMQDGEVAAEGAHMDLMGIEAYAEVVRR